MSYSSFWFVAALLVPLSAGAAGQLPPSGGQKQSFVVFDGLIYLGKPDLGLLGMPPIRGINPPATANRPTDGVDDTKVRETLQILQGYRGAVYLDYEIWPTFHA